MMLRNILIPALGLLATLVDAGSRLWESPLQQVVGNETGIAKRWIHVQIQDGPGGTRLWPKKTIRYCFADDTARQKLRGMFTAGTEAWSALGPSFKYVEVLSHAQCMEDRANVLVIQYNDRGYLATTNAVRAVDEVWNRENPTEQYNGPNMHLSDKPGVGHRDPVANVAHEIGHAWGLLHEHQNPHFWKTSTEHTNNPDEPWQMFNGDTFHTNKFKCENLKDYADKMAEVLRAPKHLGDEDRLCRDRKVAIAYKFSAMEWLPYTSEVDFVAASKVDLDSIMIYPSGAGGIGASDDGDVDDRKPILALGDGTLIPRNLRPSSGDIDALVALYGAESRPASELYVASGSKKKNPFKKIFKSSKGDDAAC